MSASSALGRAAVNAALAVGTTLALLAAAEFASRALFPVPATVRFLDSAGSPVQLLDGWFRLHPDVSIRQVSVDYDVVARIGPSGYREPEGGQPQVVFVGDSFTFGMGLGDTETFASIYCSELAIQCANLGLPGSGTYVQARALEQFLEAKGGRPREVKLFVFAMSTALMSGNDFLDTAAEVRIIGDNAAVMVGPQVEGLSGDTPVYAKLVLWLVDHRGEILRDSNLARMVYAAFGPEIRAAFSPAAAEAELAAGMAAIEAQLARIRTLASEKGFEFTIYLLHPVQDLLRGTWPETLRAVEAIAGDSRVVDTAQVFLDDPATYYFRYDGHFNASGARRVAELLLAEEEAKP